MLKFCNDVEGDIVNSYFIHFERRNNYFENATYHISNRRKTNKIKFLT